jgi:hypothetical protein
MYVVETLKSAVGRITGATRLEPRELRARLRRRKPSTTRFKDDGAIPNNSLPFVLYPGTVDLAGNDDPAAVFEQLFAANGWGDSWRNGIYDYVHYQSRTHEALGIARGSARVRFGGDGGRVVQVATLPCCRPAPGISASGRATIFSWSAPIRRPEPMTNAAARPTSMRARC